MAATSKKQLTGIVLRSRSVECTAYRPAAEYDATARPAAGALELGEHPDLLSALQADRALVVNALRDQCARATGPVALGIPASWLLARIISIPSGTPDEMRGMVELQIDKFSPFPIENTVFAHEVLTEKEGTARVLVAAVRSETIELVGAALREAGLAIQRIDINTLAWWHLIKAHPEAVHTVGRQLFILLDEDECDFLLTHDGIPILFRSLGAVSGMTPEDIDDEIIRETMATLASLEAEFGGHLAPVSLWHGARDPALLAQRLQSELGLTVQTAPLQSLPPLSQGLAVRAAEATTPLLDLVPPAWRRTAHSRQTRRRILAASGAIVALWLATLAVFIGGPLLLKRQITDRQAALKKLEVPAEDVRDTQKRALSLEQYNDRSHSALECLLEVSRDLPEGVELKSFNYRKGKFIEISGTATAISLVYDLKKALDASPLFTGIELGRVSVNNAGLQIFKITAKLPGVQE